MIPLVGDVVELERQRALVDTTAKKVMAELNIHINYKVGTMIELPRAAITADKIATQAEFFSFGTNDLTQTTFGFSRGRHGAIPGQVRRRRDPAAQSIRVDRSRGRRRADAHRRRKRAARPGKASRSASAASMAGDPQSVGFCHDLGLDYVSCSPYRIPVARLAAAQAVLHQRGVEELRARARRNLRQQKPPSYHDSALG